MINKKKLVQKMGQLSLTSKDFTRDYISAKLSENFETLDYLNNKYFGSTIKEPTKRELKMKIEGIITFLEMIRDVNRTTVEIDLILEVLKK